jgi:hypothetical protein
VARHIAEAHQRKRSIPAHHWGRVLQHFQKSFVEACDASVLAHDPGHGVAHFLDVICCEQDQGGVPRRCVRIVPRDALTELHQRVLDVARMFRVL